MTTSTLHDWSLLPGLLEKYAKQIGPTFRQLRAKLKELPPGMGYGQVWYQPETKQLWISVGDWVEDLDQWKKPFESLSGIKDIRVEGECSPPEDEPWVLVKKAYSSALRSLGQLTNFLPGPTNALLGGPSPVAATLAGGLLGAGLGYGAGTLGESLLPEEQFRPGRLRRTLALLGTALGMAPGAWWGTINQREHPDQGGKAWLSSWPFDKQSDVSELRTSLEAYLSLPSPSFQKAAAMLDPGFDQLTRIPVISRDQFGRVVQNDPLTPPPVRAATTGLVDAASWSRGGSPWITPGDIARVAVGAGSGYLSGMLTGKTLGALAGLRPEAQKELQRMGTWAGILTSVVPLVFAR